MHAYRLTDAGRIGLRMLLEAETLWRSDRRGLRLLGMDDVVDLPDEWVEPDPPPLPPEPVIGSFVACGTDENPLPFFRRWDDGWDQVGGPAGAQWTWERIVDLARARAGRDPVRLIALRPADLPWHSGKLKSTPDLGDEPRETHVWVDYDGAVRERIDVGTRPVIAVHTAASARQKAYALLAAADQAEVVDNRD